MPLFIGGLVGGLITAGTSIFGDETQQQSAQDTNATNLQINQNSLNNANYQQALAQNFNANQAAIARNFSAQQVQQQETFQQQELGQVENYDTTMSDTAMQRRVADLRAAGINPLLAVSQGGASAPTVAAPSGNIASAPSASSPGGSTPGQIPMQNTGAVWGNLGGQMASALEATKAGASIDLLKAQTNKLNAESGQEIPAQVDYLKSMTGLTDANAKQAYYNTTKIQEEIYGQRLSNDQLRDITTQLGGQNLEVLRATRDALISAANSDATAKSLGLQRLRNLNEIESSNYGKILDLLNATLQPVATAAGAVR